MFLKHVTECSWTVPVSLTMQSTKQIKFRILVSTCDCQPYAVHHRPVLSLLHVYVCACILHVFVDTCTWDAHMFLCVDIQSWHWVSFLVWINRIYWGRISHKTLSLRILTQLGSLPWGASVSAPQVLRSLMTTRPDDQRVTTSAQFYVYPKDPSFKAKFLMYMTSASSTNLSLPGPRA